MATFSQGRQVLNTKKWTELAKADELASAEVWSKKAKREEQMELKERQKLKNLALTIRRENQKRAEQNAEQ